MMINGREERHTGVDVSSPSSDRTGGDKASGSGKDGGDGGGGKHGWEE